SSATDTVALTVTPAVGPQSQEAADSIPVGLGVSSNGDSVVTWLDTTTNMLVSQSYNPDGTAHGGSHAVSPPGIDANPVPPSNVNFTGDSVYVWGVANTDGTYSVYAQRYAAINGQPLDSSPALLFNSPDEPTSLSVSLGDRGQYVLTYVVSDGTTAQAF